MSIGFSYNNGNYSELLPSGWYASYADDINDKGDVVGWGWEMGENSKGFLYSNGKFSAVLPPGWLSAHATGINNI
jgi:probable HAF family extracellular repeat protein